MKKIRVKPRENAWLSKAREEYEAARVALRRALELLDPETMLGTVEAMELARDAARHIGYGDAIHAVITLVGPEDWDLT